MKTKLLLWTAIFILTAGFADTNQAPASAAQVITLADGSKLKLLGTTFGRQHRPPSYERLGTLNPIYSPTNDTTVVWIEDEHEAGKWPNFELLVYDKANTACVNIEPRRPSSHVKNGLDLQGFVLNAFPRWEKETILRVRPYGGAIPEGFFVLTNPAFTSFMDWTPKPLPDTQQDGNLEVTLTRLVAGKPMPYYKGKNPGPTNDPANQCVWLDFNFRQDGQSTTNWQPWPVRIFDAAGNQARGLIRDYPRDGIYDSPQRFETDGYFFHPGLWPDVPAWQVRLEFIQRAGFTEDQIITFTNLPVRPGTQQDHDDEWTWDASNTNFSFVAQGEVNGAQLKLLPPLLVPNSSQPGQKYISVLIYADPNFNPQGMNLTLLHATDDQGRDTWSPFGSSWAGHYNLELPNPRDTKTLNLKLALHKSRFIEFTVKPTKQ